MIVQPPPAGQGYEEVRRDLGLISKEIHIDGRSVRLDFPKATLVTRYIEPPIISMEPFGFFLGEGTFEAWIELGPFNEEGNIYTMTVGQDDPEAP